MTIMIRGAALLAALMVSGGGATAAGPGALAHVTPGEWQLREPGTGAVRRLCVTDPAMLSQVRHGDGAVCTRSVLSSDAHTTTIAYTCKGAGQGLTTITVDSTDQVRLQTQGLIGGQPFDTAYEGKLVGRCG